MTNRTEHLYRRLRSRVGSVKRRLMGRPGRLPRSGEPVLTPRPSRPKEETNLGPVMDGHVARIWRRTQGAGDPDYDLVYDNFDPLFYTLGRARLLDRPNIDLVRHYLETGRDSNRGPNPHFSMQNYLKRYPERGESSEDPFVHWMRRGKSAGEIADPAPATDEMADVLGLDEHELVEQLVERRTDLLERLRVGKLGEVWAKAAKVEPLVGIAWTEMANPRMLPFGNPVVPPMVAALYKCQEQAGFRRARLILVTNRPRWGGGRRMEGHIAHAVSSRVPPGDIVVIHTDESGQSPPGRYPEGVREVDFAGLTEGIEPEDKQRTLVALLRSFHADAIVNVNSAVFYQAMRTYGKALAASERVFVCFFCNEEHPTGHWDGYSLRHFYRLYDLIEGVITDSDHLARELVELYQLGEGPHEGLHVFRAPVDPDTSLVEPPPAEPERRPQIFWAGRWDRQKRVGLFIRIARRMPDLDFHMWGEPFFAGGRPKKLPPNLIVEGRFDHISQVPLGEADLWLYTSGWDGVPSILLEIGMTGVPIVGTVVGGTGEIIDENGAYPVAEVDEIELYENAIRVALADPVEARRRARALRERLLRDRSRKAFAEHVADVLLSPDPSATTRARHPSGERDTPDSPGPVSPSVGQLIPEPHVDASHGPTREPREISESETDEETA